MLQDVTGSVHRQSMLILIPFLTISDCSIESDCVSLHTFAQRSFEELQGLLPLLAFLTRTGGSIVSDMVSRKR